MLKKPFKEKIKQSRQFDQGTWKSFWGEKIIEEKSNSGTFGGKRKNNFYFYFTNNLPSKSSFFLLSRKFPCEAFRSPMWNVPFFWAARPKKEIKKKASNYRRKLLSDPLGSVTLKNWRSSLVRQAAQPEDAVFLLPQKQGRFTFSLNLARLLISLEPERQRAVNVWINVSCSEEGIKGNSRP